MLKCDEEFRRDWRADPKESRRGPVIRGVAIGKLKIKDKSAALNYQSINLYTPIKFTHTVTTESIKVFVYLWTLA